MFCKERKRDIIRIQTGYPSGYIVNPLDSITLLLVSCSHVYVRYPYYDKTFFLLDRIFPPLKKNQDRNLFIFFQLETEQVYGSRIFRAFGNPVIQLDYLHHYPVHPPVTRGAGCGRDKRTVSQVPYFLPCKKPLVKYFTLQTDGGKKSYAPITRTRQTVQSCMMDSIQLNPYVQHQAPKVFRWILNYDPHFITDSHRHPKVEQLLGDIAAQMTMSCHLLTRFSPAFE